MAAAIWLCPVVGLAEDEPSPARRLHDEAFVVDLHLDTATQLWRRDLPLDQGQPLEAGLPLLRRAGVDLAIEALWMPRTNVVPDPASYVWDLGGRLQGELNRHEDVVQLRWSWQLEKLRARENALAVLVALEGAQCLRGDGREDLRRLYHEMGVRMVGLTWSMRTAFSDSSAEAAPVPGLTDAGRGLVSEMNDLGIVIDVSHMSDTATRQTVELSRAPVLASHSNARALCDQPRNLSDELLAAIGERGGMVGVMFHAPFLCAREAAVPAVADHIEHIARVAGRGAVGIGSDFDGIIQTGPDLRDITDLPAVTVELARRGWSDEDLRGLLGENFLRLWRAVEAERVPLPEANKR